jgi:hypothetical protein
MAIALTLDVPGAYSIVPVCQETIHASEHNCPLGRNTTRFLVEINGKSTPNVWLWTFVHTASKLESHDKGICAIVL